MYHCMSPPLGGMAVEASRRLPLGGRGRRNEIDQKWSRRVATV